MRKQPGGRLARGHDRSYFVREDALRPALGDSPDRIEISCVWFDRSIHAHRPADRLGVHPFGYSLLLRSSAAVDVIAFHRILSRLRYRNARLPGESDRMRLGMMLSSLT